MLSSDPIGTNTGRREEELTVEEGSRRISHRVSIGLRGSREESTGRKLFPGYNRGNGRFRLERYILESVLSVLLCGTDLF